VQCTKSLLTIIYFGDTIMKAMNLDLVNEYNAKVMQSVRAFGDMGVANVQAFVDKQVALNKSLLEAGMATQKEMAAAKAPADAVKSASALVQFWADAMTGYAKDASESATKVGEEVKVAIDDAVKLNSEYAAKAFDTGVEAVKTTAKKAAAA
jgi:hypothetical protein